MASDDVRALAERIVAGLQRYGDKGLRLQMEMLARAVLAQETRPTWQPIETAPKDVACWFWLRPLTEADPHYVTTSGMPILTDGEPHALVCQYGHWSSLWTATHWQPYVVPAPPDQPRERVRFTL